MAKNLTRSIGEALRSVQADVDAVRTRLDELREERANVEAAPRSIADVERDVDLRIAQAVARQPFRMAGFWSPFASPDEAVMAFNFGVLGADLEDIAETRSGGSRARRIGGDFFAFLATWDAPKLKSLILQHAPEGIDDKRRASEIVRIDREIEAAEILEELMLRELEAVTGTAAMRRADVDLAIVLAPQDELEGARR
jgi:hypothetical protein